MALNGRAASPRSSPRARRLTWLGPLALALACGAFARDALAQAAPPPTTVWLRELPCEPARYDPGAFASVLQLELAALSLQLQRWPDGEPEQDAALAAALAVLTMRCGQATDEIEIELDELASRTHSTRSVAFGELPADARARMLALAASAALEHSLRAALSEPGDGGAEPRLALDVAAQLRARMQQRFQLPAEPPPAPPPGVAAVPEPEPIAGPVELAAMMRAFPAYSTALLGAQGGVALALASRLTLDLDGEVLFGNSELTDAQGTVGAMWLYWFTAGLGLSLHAGGGPELALGPRVRIGYGLADAETERAGASARDDQSPLLAVLLAATLRAPIGRDASLLIAADLGYTAVGVVFVGDQARLSGMAGVTTALRVGVSL